MALKLAKKTNKIQKIVKKAPAAPAGGAAKAAPAEQSAQTFTIPTGEFVEAIGRRKVATARVRLYKGEGDFVVNDKVVGEYFSTVANAHMRYNRPFEATGTKGNFAVTVKVSGSGPASQLDAVIHGISRALVAFDPEYRTLLKSAGLLTRDPRMKETRKIGSGGKARRKRQSPRR